MNIDQAIAALQAAREKLGGDVPVWVRPHGVGNKWDEELVERIVPVDDGESRYVRLVGVGEPDDTPPLTNDQVRARLLVQFPRLKKGKWLVSYLPDPQGRTESCCYHCEYRNGRFRKLEVAYYPHNDTVAEF